MPSMADRMNLSAEPFGKRRRRGRPPGQSQQANTNWRAKWAQLSQLSKADTSLSPSYQETFEPVQPALEHRRRPIQNQRRLDPMAIQVVDLTDDVEDEESAGPPRPGRLRENIQSRRRLESRTFRQDSSTPVPRARHADRRSSKIFNRNEDYASGHDNQGWQPESGVDEDDCWSEPRDRNNNVSAYERPLEKGRDFVERQPRQQRLHEPRRERDHNSHSANLEEDYSAKRTRGYLDGRKLKDTGIRDHQHFPPKSGNRNFDAFPPEHSRNGQSGNRNVTQWLKTSIVPPLDHHHNDEQQRALQFNFRSLDDSVAVNVPDSQGSSIVDDHDRSLDGQGRNCPSTLNTSFTPPLLNQRAHQLKLDLKERFARIRLQNNLAATIPSQPTQTQAPSFLPPNSRQVVQPAASGSRVRFRDEILDVSSAANPAKRQRGFSPFEPPPDTQVGGSQYVQNATADRAYDADGGHRLRIPPEISTVSEAELRTAQAEEEERTEFARERERLLEQDEDLQRMRREERQAQLRIELDEAKAARVEEHQQRMEVLEETQRAVAEKVAQQEAGEEKRKAAQAERKRLSKKEEQAVLHEAALQRSIQARKEHEALKAKKAAATTALREECNGSPVSQKPINGPSAKIIKPSLHGTLPYQQAEAQEPLGLREVDLQNLMKKQKAEKQAEIQRQREEKRRQREEEKRAKELLREENRKKKEAEKLARQDRPLKRPVKLPKPGALVQSTTQQVKEAPKKTLGGFLEDDSRSGSSSDTESDEDALFCSAPKEIISVDVSSPNLPGTTYHKTAPESSTASANVTNHVPNFPRQALHPTTGGKSIGLEAMAACLATLHDLRDLNSDDEDAEADVDPDVEEIVRKRETRQQSPITDRDIYHWSYRVERKTWSPRTEEDAVQWIVCGRLGYSSLQKANALADKESIRQRLGLSLQPYTREWSRKLDENDMVHIYMDGTNDRKTPGYVKIRVVRQLRAYSNGVRPETKFGWIDKTVWEIQKTTTTTIPITSPPREADGENAGEEGSGQEPQVETEQEIEMLSDEIYTNVDEANRKAADFAVNLAVPKPHTRNLTELVAYKQKREENLEALTEMCDQLEQEGKSEMFEAEYQMDETSTIKIEVVARPLVGPRNI